MATNIQQQKEAARLFAEYWCGKGYEKGQSQPFWLSLLREIFGISEPEKFITFEDQVHLDNTSFIDGYIDSTLVMIEQKSLGKDLQKKIKQSNGALLTPYEQAKRYSMELPYSKRPRWIVTSNFESFLIYDMERPGVEPQLIYLKDLPEEYWRLEFLVDDEKHRIQKEQDISEDAGKIIKVLYDALAKCYGDMTDPVNQKSLNKLIVRIVFCLYAEDSEMFSHGQFQDYLGHFDADDLSDALYNLFQVLDTQEEQRRRGLKAILAAFPYTNGGLFHDKANTDDNVIPELSEEVKRILVEVAAPFNWSAISPTIFGGIFESTLNPETRRNSGMHYTSIENIHKVIDPLFLDDLKTELNKDLDIKVNGRRNDALLSFQDKIAGLKFLDPACGSGNFLTETYLSLRRLENKAIKALYGEGMLGLRDDLIKVSIQQFYGIEINDFAVSVATTALWISEAQMLRETESIIAHSLPALPLKTYTNIHEGNALRMDWNDVVPASEVDYIMGNPPFIGARMMAQGSEQKKDVENLFGKIKDVQDLDYVCCWFRKAAEMIQGTSVNVGFVATNSICQGAQVPILWDVLLNTFNVHIDYAYQTFKWESEASEKAAVHCVIIGFSINSASKKKTLFLSDGTKQTVLNISPYLVEGPSIFAVSQKKPLCDVPQMNFGNQPRDGGFFIFSDEEKSELEKEDPKAAAWLHPYIGAVEFIQRKSRWCLWLRNASPGDIRSSKALYERVDAVRQFRLSSNAKTTIGYAKVPHLFAQITQPEGVDCLLIPSVSSENRYYVPIGFIPAGVITSNAVQIVPDATLYHFGVLTSSVHMAWMRVVCGRLEMRYRYSKEQVYNPFPWPAGSVNREKIEKSAQGILDARAKYPESSFADLYDPVTMPYDLQKAHRANDLAVLEAYGFPKDASESEIVARLFKMYQELTNS